MKNLCHHNKSLSRRIHILRHRTSQFFTFHAPLFILLLSFFIPFLLSCSQAERLYDSFPAYFIFPRTNSVPQLNTAMGGLGEFCIIQDNGARLNFIGFNGATPYNKTAVEGYAAFRLGRAGGLIVGQPTMMSDTPGVVCYDHICPTCYKDEGYSRGLELTAPGMVKCGRCQRTYDLNNQGLLATGDPGRRLYKYHCTFRSNTLTVDNR